MNNLKFDNGKHFALFVIVFLSVISLIFVVSSLTPEQEISQLEQDLADSGYDWLSDYEIDYPDVEVYEAGSSDLIMTIEDIGEYGKYRKVFDGWNGSSAEFDLLIQGSDIDVDYITDPAGAPQIEFVSPTPSNDSTETNLMANVSITENNLSELIFHWNGENHTIYDDFLIASFNFDNRSELGENDTLFYDISGNGNNGTGTNFDLDEVVPGKYGAGLELDGSNDYFDLANDQSNALTNNSYSAWVKVAGNGAGSNGGIISRMGDTGNPNDDNEQQTMYYNNANKLACSGSYNSGGSGASSDINLDQWYHSLCTWEWNGTSMITTLYLDGALVGQGVGTGMSTFQYSGGNYRIGARKIGHSRYLNGTIDNVQIWNRTLNAGEAYHVYATSLTQFNGTFWNAYLSKNKNTNGTDSFPDESLDYTYQFYASDGADNTNETALRSVTIAVPKVSLDIVDYSSNVRAIQNQGFEVKVNVSCSVNDCGEINISLDPPAAAYEASGAGTSVYNQVYVEDGTYNGEVSYIGVTDDTYDIYFSFDISCWVIGDKESEFFGGGGAYYECEGSDAPELTGWFSFDGADPAPTLAESTGGGGKSETGLVNTTIGATPFYTNESNPWNISLNQDQSQVLTWWVNATGEVGESYEFFAFSNLTSDMSNTNISANWSVEIGVADVNPSFDFDAFASNSGTDEWVAIHHDLNNTGYTTSNGPANISSADSDSYDYGGGISNTPLVWNEKVYFSDGTNGLHVVNESDITQELDSLSQTSASNTKSAIAGGYLYVSNPSNKKLYQYNATNLSEQIGVYTFTGNDLFGGPAIAGGYVYQGAGDSTLYQLNASNVSLKISEFEFGSTESWDTPAVVNGYVYFGADDDKVYMLNGNNISEKYYEYETGGRIRASSPTYWNGYLFFGSEDNKLHRVNATDLGDASTISLADDVDRSPSVANGYVYTMDENNKLYQYNATNFSQKIGEYSFSADPISPVVTEEYVYITSESSTIYQLDAQNISNLIGLKSVSGSVNPQSLSVAKGFLYAGDLNGNLYQIGTLNETEEPEEEEEIEFLIAFQGQTPSNGTSTTNTSIEINTTIVKSNLSSLTYNWNGTNYTMFNDSLVLMLNFNEYSLDNSTSLNGINATSNDATWISSGKYGGAYNFTPNGDNIEYSGTENIVGDEFSVFGWVNVREYVNYYTLFGKAKDVAGTWNTEVDWGFLVNSGNIAFKFTNNPGTERIEVTSISGGSTDTWYFVGATWDGTNLKGYGDGVLTASTSSETITIGTEHPFRVAGSDGTSTRQFDGMVDEIFLFNRSLNADEVYQLYVSSLTKFNSTNWELYVNQSLNATDGLPAGDYTYQAFAEDGSGNTNETDLRSLTVEEAGDEVVPLIEFQGQTPSNGTSTSNTSIEINTSIVESDLDTLTYNWNGTNYTMFNDSLVLFYNFDNRSALGENDTRVVDLSGNGNNGTVSGAVVNTIGKYNGAFTFDGVDDYVDSNSISFGSSDVITFSVWVNKSEMESEQAVIFMIGSSLGLGYDNVNNRPWVLKPGVGNFYGTTDSVPDNGWTNLIFNVTSSATSWYVDGVYDGSTAKGHGGGSLLIGKRNTNAQYVNGSLDDVQIWNRYLSSQEIYQLYVSSLTKFDSENWELYVNQSLNATDSLLVGDYTYQAFAEDGSGNTNETDLRSLTIEAAADTTNPLVAFQSQTPANATTTTNTSVEINVSIVESNLRNLTYNWNGTNYTMFNDSLVLFYNFDNRSDLGENNTLVYDLSGTGNNGTVDGAVVNATSSKYGNSFTFDGSNDRVSSETVGFSNETGTVSMWIRPDSNAVTTESNFFLFDIENPRLAFYLDDSGHRVSLYSVSTEFFGADASGWTDEWHHIAFTYDFSSDVYKIFADGKLTAIDTTAQNTASVSNNLSIGARFTTIAGNVPFDGLIDDVQIWNRSLSSDEVYQLYASSLTKFNNTNWELYVNQSLNATDGLPAGDYTYQSFAEDGSGNTNETDLRSLTIEEAGDEVVPLIEFQGQTPDNATTTANTSIEINTSIVESDLDSLTYNWNGTNYTMFNDSLVAFYNFDNRSALGENDTYVVDLSGNGNNGTVNGSAFFNSSGKYNGALDFEGSNDYVNISDSNSLDFGTGPFTYSIWLNTKDISQRQVIAEKRDGGGNNELYWAIETSAGAGTSDGEVHFYLLDASGGGSNLEQKSTDTLLTSNEWYHVVAMRETDGTMKAYINGILQSDTKNSNDDISSSSEMLVGVHPAGVRYFNGSLDEFKIWDRSLSDAEVYQLYASSLTKFNNTNWELYVNQSLNATDSLPSGDYTYQSFAEDGSGNTNETDLRSLTIENSAQIGLNMVTPSDFDGVNVTQYELFNITANVSCIGSNCEEINVTLSYPLGTDLWNEAFNDYTGTPDDNNDDTIENWTRYSANSGIEEITNSGRSGTGLKLRPSQSAPTSSIGKARLDEIFDATDSFNVSFYYRQQNNNAFSRLTIINATDDTTLYSITLPDQTSWTYYNHFNDTLNYNETQFQLEGGTDLNGFGYYSYFDDFIVHGGTSFVPNASSVINITLNQDESQIVTWYVNATGSVETVGEFYVYANQTADQSISNSSSAWNVTIVEAAGDETAPVVNLQAPTNASTVATSTVSFNATFTDETGLSNSTLYVWNSTGDVINSTEVDTLSGMADGTNQSIVLPYEDTFTWNYLVRDTSSNSAWNSTNWTVTLDYVPEISFTEQTPANATTTSNESIEINTTIVESNLGSLIYNWNGTNYTMFNDSLVAFYNFDNRSSLGENGTYIVDLSGNGNNGTGNGSIVNTISSRYGNSITFSGNNYVDFGDSSEFEFGSTRDFSLVVWFKTNDTTNTGRSILGKMPTGGGAVGYRLQKGDGSTNNYVQLVLWDSSNSIVSASNSGDYLDDNWHQVVTTRTGSGTNLSIYIDGVLINSAIVTARDVGTTGNFFVGGDNWQGGTPSQPWLGSVDDVQVWNKSLSSDEVYQLYTSSLTKFNSTNWELYINQSLNGTDSLLVGDYTYQSFVEDGSGNTNSTDLRSLTIESNGDEIVPLIEFTGQTPPNDTTTTNVSIEINASIVESDLQTLEYKWNGTNYTMFNDSLVAFYNFDNRSSLGENGTYIVDLSGNGNNGAGTSFDLDEIVSGKYGNAIEFDGTNDYIEVGSVDTATLFSVSQWVNITSVPETFAQITGTWDGSGGDKAWGVGLYWSGSCPVDDRSVYFQLYDSGGSSSGKVFVTPADSINFGEWHHITAVRTGSTSVQIYIDGVAQSLNNCYSGTPGDVTPGDKPLRIGARGGGGRINGTIDDVQIWNYSLSSEEVQQLYMFSLTKFNSTNWEFYVNQSLNATDSLPLGDYTYQAFAEDGSGNANETDLRILTIEEAGDETVPVVNLQAPTNGSTVTTQTVSFNATFTDETALSNSTLYVWNSTGNVINSTEVDTLTGTTDGTNTSIVLPYEGTFTWNYHVEDSSSNSAWNSTNWTLTLDYVPGIEFQGQTPDNATTTTNTSVEINASIVESNLDSLTYNWNGTNYTYYNDSLVLFYNFDNRSALGENDTLVVDISGNGNNGIVDGAVVNTTSSKYGNSFTFDGNDYVDSGDINVAEGVDQLTVSAWINRETEDAYQGIVSKYGSGGSRSWLLYVSGTGGGGTENAPEFLVVADSTTHTDNTENTGLVSLNTWTHIVGVYNGTDVLVYQDGTLRGNASNSGNIASTSQNVEIGRYNSGNYFNGEIDDVQIWNRSLSSQEVYQLYASSLTKFNSTNWELYVNQSLNATDGLPTGDYTYQAFAEDGSGNSNKTEERTVTMESAGDEVVPLIEFQGQTPSNATTTQNTSIEINTSIVESDLDTLTYNWNGTNYTMFNDSLVAFYNFDNRSALGENDTHVVDLSGYGNNGTGTNFDLDEVVSGKYGNAIDFDGTNDYLKTSNDIYSSSQLVSGTVSAWVKTTQTPASESDIVNGEGWINFGLDSNGKAQACSDGQCTFATSTTSINDGSWHSIVMTWSGGTYTNVYVDGVLEDTSDPTAGPNLDGTSRPFAVGANHGGANPFDGIVDDVQVWNRSLSSEEVYQLYASSLTKFNNTNWELYVNQSLNATDGLPAGDYTYQAFAEDGSGNTNQTDLRALTVEEAGDETAPVVNLQAPTNGSTVTSATVSFNATFTDETALSNSTLYVWNSTGDVINSTEIATISGTSNGTNQSIVLPYEDTFSWNYYVEDTSSNSAWNSTNWTVTYATPKINLDVITPEDFDGRNVTQNTWFNVSVNVSCIDANCGEVNVSLDPETTVSLDYTNSSADIYHFDGPNGADFTVLSKWDITSIPADQTINDAKACFYIQSKTGSLGSEINVSYVPDQSWDEGASTSTINGFSLDNSTITDLTSLSTSTYTCINVTTQFQESYGASDSNFTISFFSTTYGTDSAEAPSDNNGLFLGSGGSNVYLVLEDRENSKSSGSRPYLNVTYSSGGGGGGAKSGLISTTTGATPFYTNITNPYNVSLNSGESQVITWYVNATGSTDTTHTFFAYANKTSGDTSVGNTTNQWNVTIVSADESDTTAPNVTSLTEKPDDGVTYSSGARYEFNSTVEDNEAVDSVRIEFDGVNYSASNLTGSTWNFTLFDLAAGSYNYRWFANDTSNNINNTEAGSYTIAKTGNNADVLLNGGNSNVTVTYGNTVNASANASQGSVVLYRDALDVTGSENNQDVVLGAGTYNYTAYTAGNENYSSASETWFAIVNKASSVLNLTFNGTEGNATATQGSSVTLNGTLVSGDSAGYIELYNNGTLINNNTGSVQNDTTFGTAGLYNISVFYSQSENYSSSSETYWLNVTAVLDETNPSVSGLTENPSDGGSYDESQRYEFNSSVSDETALDSVLLEFDGVNYTLTGLGDGNRYNKTFGTLGVGTYNYRWIVNDTSGNSNTTETGSYTINQASTTTDLLLNGQNSNVTVSYLVALNASANGSQSGVVLYRDGVDVTSGENGLNITLAVGEYNYTAYTTGNENYTGSSETWFVIVNQATPSGSLAGTATITYGTAGDVEGTESNTGDGDVTYTLFRDDEATSNPDTSVLGAGSYSYKYNATSGGNYTATQLDTFSLTVSKAQSQVNLTFNGTEGNASATTGSSVVLNGTVITGDNSGRILLYNNGTLINNGTESVQNNTEFGTAGLYNITVFYSESENYSSSSETYWLNVTAEPDETNPEVTVIVPENVTYLAANGTLNFSVQLNEEGYVEYSLDSGANNVTMVSADDLNFSDVNDSMADGAYRFNVYSNDTSGNRNDTEYVDFTVNASRPVITLVNPEAGVSYIGTSQSVDFRYNVTDDSIAHCNLTSNDVVVNSSLSGDGFADYTVSKTETNNFTYTFSEGSYSWYVNCIDFAGNTNQSEERTISVSSGSGSSGGSGGSSGGGGGSSSSVRNTGFNVDQVEIRKPLLRGVFEEGSVGITNNGNKAMTVSIEVQALREFIDIPASLVLEPGEKKNLVFGIKAIDKGILTGKMIFSSESDVIEVPIVLDVKTENFLFDAKIGVTNQRAEVNDGVLKSQIDLLEAIGSGNKVDVVATYVIKDFDGNVLMEDHETFFVQGNKNFVKEFDVSTLGSGKYVLGLEIVYPGAFATSSSQFEIKPEGLSGIGMDVLESQKGIILIAGLVALIFLLGLWILMRKHSIKLVKHRR